jgi:hypothetical protein
LSSYDVDGSSTTKEGVEKQGIRQIIREEIRTYFQDPLGYEKEFKGWLPEWIGQSGIDIPISQVIGFSGFTVTVAPRINANELTSSASYGDLATVGPVLTGLPDGQYFIILGCIGGSGAVRAVAMAPKVNSTEAVDDNAAIISDTTVGAGGVGACAMTLDGGGNNTITARYRSVTGLNVAISNRWMAVLKYTNA